MLALVEPVCYARALAQFGMVSRPENESSRPASAEPADEGAVRGAGTDEPAQATSEKPEAVDEDASLTPDQVSDDPPEACDEEPPELAITSRVPAAIEPGARLRAKRRDAPVRHINRRAELFGGEPESSPSSPPPPTSERPPLLSLDAPRSRREAGRPPERMSLPPVAKGSVRGLPSYALALFAALFGVAAIATILAVLIQTDGPRPASSAEPKKSAAPNATAPAPTTTTPAPPSSLEPTRPASSDEAPPPGPFRVASLANDESVRLVSGKLGTRSLIDALEEEKVPTAQIMRALKAFEDPKVFDHPRKSHVYAVALDRATKRIKAFEYQATAVDVWQAREGEDGALVGTKIDFKVETRRVAKAVVVKEDLKQSIVDAGFDDDLLDKLSDAMEDRMSLSRLGRGATLRIIAVEQTSYGRFVRYTDVEAIEWWTPKSDKPVRLYHWKSEKGAGYYDESGKAPFKGGWRYPVKFPRVTSPFNPKRLHPVLHVVMPHNGTDFGAPSGTPIFAASHGTVIHVGPKGPGGNTVEIAHTNGIETGYLHMSKFAPGIKKGDKVETRQLIGFVGTTGRSTGPHLHFWVKKASQFVDPMTTLKMDGERVLPPSEREPFGGLKAELDKILDALPLPERGAGTQAPADDEDQDQEGDPAPAGSGAPPAPGAPAAPQAPAAKKEDPPPAPTDDKSSPVWNPL